MIKLELNEQEVQIIGAGLGKLPFESVAVLVNKLNQQIADQQPKPTTTMIQPKKVKNV